MMRGRVILPLLIALMLPGAAFAHQPRIVETAEINVENPAISKAYYAELTGNPHVYRFSSAETFNLYVNILVPEKDGQRRDLSAVIYQNGKELVRLEGEGFLWRHYFEEFGYDAYLMGPEYRERAEVGEYEVHVSNPGNSGKYALAIGETEAFNFNEALSAYTIIPQLKTDFFNVSPASFVFSPLGWGLILMLYAIAGAVLFMIRFALSRLFPTTRFSHARNIGTLGRIVRLAIAAGILVFAISTTWSLLLIFISGLVFFESLLRWCALYALIGRNTCAAV